MLRSSLTCLGHCIYLFVYVLCMFLRRVNVDDDDSVVAYNFRHPVCIYIVYSVGKSAAGVATASINTRCHAVTAAAIFVGNDTLFN